MLMNEKLMEYFNKQPRLGTLSTVDNNGKVNSAYFAQHAGESAGKMIHAAISFEIQEIRQLADFGQGWEKSI